MGFVIVVMKLFAVEMGFVIVVVMRFIAVVMNAELVLDDSCSGRGLEV
jgi:hypothetical protein